MSHEKGVRGYCCGKLLFDVCLSVDEVLAGRKNLLNVRPDRMVSCWTHDKHTPPHRPSPFQPPPPIPPSHDTHGPEVGWAGPICQQFDL